MSNKFLWAWMIGVLTGWIINQFPDTPTWLYVYVLPALSGALSWTLIRLLVVPKQYK